MGVYWNKAIRWINGHVIQSLFIIPSPWVSYIETPHLADMSNAQTLFESRGCLLLLVKNRNRDAKYHIFEMRNEYSGWSMKYSVYLDDIVPRARMLSFLCAVLGEREEDSCMVVEVNGYVFQYKFLSKTVSTLCNSVSSSSLRSFPFIPSLAGV